MPRVACGDEVSWQVNPAHGALAQGDDAATQHDLKDCFAGTGVMITDPHQVGDEDVSVELAACEVGLNMTGVFSMM